MGKKIIDNRVILLVDIDSFSVQVLQKTAAGADTVGKPCVVALDKKDMTIKLTAISYEAKAFGIMRNDTLEEAIAKCPEVAVIRFPPSPADPKKPDLQLQTQATKEIVNAALEYCNTTFDKAIRPVFHLASIDEFYLDVTAAVNAKAANGGTDFPDVDQNYRLIVEDANGPTDVKNWKPSTVQEERLLHGLRFAADVVKVIREKTGLHASVGVGPNKLIAKLACGLNKPQAVTLVLPEGFHQISKRIPIPQAPGLGGAAGKALMRSLKVSTSAGGDIPDASVQYLGDLTAFTLDQIAVVPMDEAETRKLGTKKGQEIYETIHGIDESVVTEKLKFP